MRKDFPDKANSIATLSRPLKQNTLHLMVSRKYPGAKNLIQKFNLALLKIRNKGIYQKLLDKYGVTGLHPESGKDPVNTASPPNSQE